MARIVGGAMLVCCGAWWGLMRAGKLRKRLGALEAWTAALVLLEGELAFSLPALPELLVLLSERAAEPAGEVFAAALAGMEELGRYSFGEIWRRVLAGFPGGLWEEDVLALSRLGEVLGRYGWEEQISALRAVRSGLEEVYRREAGRAAGQGKTWVTVGVCLGTFGAILLL